MRQLIALLLLAVSLSATDYYINGATGSNGNSGTDTAHPWLDYTNINAGSFSGDDVLHFACYADTSKAFYGRMIFPSSGTSGHPITITSYCSSGTCDPQVSLTSADGCAILDGGMTYTGYVTGGGSYTLQDFFASGSYSGSWTSTAGSIGTPASFSISNPPTSGGSYVAKLTTAQASYITVSSTATECAETPYWILSGSDTTKRTMVTGLNHGATNYAIVMFSASTDTTANKLRVFLTQQPGGQQEFYGNASISASTWYRVKTCMYSDASAGWVAIWLDQNDGHGYQLELVKNAVNTGAGDITRVYMGYPATGNTEYFGGFELATSDPSINANVSFIGIAYDPTSNGPEPSRAWNGVTTLNPIQQASNEIVPNAGAAGAVTNNQWDLTQAANGNFAVFWVYPDGGGSAANVEVVNRSLFSPIRLNGTDYLTFSNLLIEHGEAGIHVGSGTQTTYLTFSHNFCWDNSGHCQYDDKTLPLKGSDHEYFGWIDCENDHWSYHEDQPLPPDYPPAGKGGHCIYATKLTNSTVEYVWADQMQGGCLAEFQDNADNNILRYSQSSNGGCLFTNTTDLGTGDTGNQIYSNTSLNDYIAVYGAQATGAYIYGNTFYNYTKYCVQNASTAFIATSGWQNNVCWSNVSGATAVHSTGASGNLTSDYSDWGPATTCLFSNNGTCYDTLAAWPGKGAHDVSADPLLNTLLIPLAASPLIGTGVSLSSTYQYGFNPAVPMTLVNRNSFHGGAWDIGAFVVTGGYPVTVNKVVR